MFVSRTLANQVPHSCGRDPYSTVTRDSLREAQEYCAGTVQTWKSTMPFTELLESAKEPLTIDISSEVASGAGNGLGRDT